MKKRSIASLLGTTIMLLFFLRCATYDVSCEDGNYMRYRRPDKVFPPYAKSYDHAVKLTFHIIDSVQAVADVALKNKVIEMREKLDQNNALIQELLKTNFMKYNMCLCDKEARLRYDNFELYMLKCIEQLNAANAQLRTISDLKSTEEQEKLLDILSSSIAQTNQVIHNGPAVDPASDTSKTKRNFKVFVKYVDKHINESNLIFNGIVNAFDSSLNAHYEYYFLLGDEKLADFEIVVSNVAVHEKPTDYRNEDESCDYEYNFTLLKMDKKTGKTKGIGAEMVNSKYCGLSARERDVANKFKDVSSNLEIKMLEK